jgi:hypothetical protein
VHEQYEGVLATEAASGASVKYTEHFARAASTLRGAASCSISLDNAPTSFFYLPLLAQHLQKAMSWPGLHDARLRFHSALLQLQPFLGALSTVQPPAFACDVLCIGLGLRELLICVVFVGP